MIDRRALLVSVPPCVFLLDRLTKNTVLRAFQENASLAVWPGILRLTRVNNTGAAFGMLQNAPLFLTIVSTVSVAAVAVYLARRFFLRSHSGGSWGKASATQAPTDGCRAPTGAPADRCHIPVGVARRPALRHFGWALVAGGAAGNLYDRVRYGYVIDFIDLRVWPVFNVADAAITSGAVLIAACLLFQTKKKTP